jgi:hypothetical protein
VQQGDSAGEGLLHLSGAGDGEVDGAELRLGEVFVVVMRFVFVRVVVSEGGEIDEAHEQEEEYESFHG